MNLYSNQSGKAYYYDQIQSPGFLSANPNDILNTLVTGARNHGFDDAGGKQYEAWQDQISSLQTELKKTSASGYIIFEYDIVRMGKRIDVVLLLRHMVFSLEYKNGATSYLAEDMAQAEDYALDLKNFHKESENLYVCPILIATNAKSFQEDRHAYKSKRIRLQKSNNANLVNIIQDIEQTYGDDGVIDFQKWFNSEYCPTPTIVDAAVTIYHNHDVSEIAHSEAGEENIKLAEDTLNKIIDHTKANNRKAIVFLTGVPGAGKTLVGLDLSIKRMDEHRSEGEKAVFLSGNGPLVDILQTALARSAMRYQKDQNKKTYKNITEAKSSVRAFIQAMYAYRNSLLDNNGETPVLKAPEENIVIFDEAQRVWNKDKLSTWAKKKKGIRLNMSEPSFLLETMDKRKGWGVLICLVGLGQNIYQGETGINEWIKEAMAEHPDWDIYFSKELLEQTEDPIENPKAVISHPNTHIVEGLHLSVSVRSYRSNLVSKFVDCLLENKPDEAKDNYDKFIDKYPVYITRDLAKAKTWAKSHCAGSERCGLMASSSGLRLRADGIYTPVDLDVENWFLAPKTDLRSSNMMEIAASEFKVQGLEIDWGVIGWDADLRRKGNSWDLYKLTGCKWQKRKEANSRTYLINSYRVLLTRSRQGFVIFVPKGVSKEEDPTRDQAFYDGIYYYLTKCGIQELTDDLLTEPMESR